MTMATTNTNKFSQPIRHGDGYVIDEQRGNLAFRSHILPTRAAALAYRAEQIRKSEKQ